MADNKDEGFVFKCPRCNSTVESNKTDCYACGAELSYSNYANEEDKSESQSNSEKSSDKDTAQSQPAQEAPKASPAPEAPKAPEPGSIPNPEELIKNKEDFDKYFSKVNTAAELAYRTHQELQDLQGDKNSALAKKEGAINKYLSTQARVNELFLGLPIHTQKEEIERLFNEGKLYDVARTEIDSILDGTDPESIPEQFGKLFLTKERHERGERKNGELLGYAMFALKAVSNVYHRAGKDSELETLLYNKDNNVVAALMKAMSEKGAEAEKANLFPLIVASLEHYAPKDKSGKVSAYVIEHYKENLEAYKDIMVQLTAEFNKNNIIAGIDKAQSHIVETYKGKQKVEALRNFFGASRHFASREGADKKAYEDFNMKNLIEGDN